MATAKDRADDKKKLAHMIEGDYKMGNRDLSEVISAYEKAGKAYEKALKIPDAVNCYKEASRYSTGTEKERLNAKIKDTLEENTENILRLKKWSRDITKKYGLSFLSITFLLSALIFTSFSLTGYSIGGLVENNFRFIGTGLFILGLIFAFLHFKMKGKK